ncbi:MAG: tetratricopeptide repeat protein [Candidatus Poseidoniaceae archaeon]|nr:tetratricopeptide repeat protein [Candidatus Poseidoniaceae archaeon]
MLEQVRKVRLAVLACLFAILAVPQVSAAQVTDISDIKLEYFYPALVAFAVAIPVWRWFIPNQLANLQVAFEIDDDLYEVHRITKNVDDARALLQEGGTAYGIGLYVMGMTGVLLLIAELLFNPDTYYLPNLFLIGVLVVIPVIISPWETLNVQLVGTRKGSSKGKIYVKVVRRMTTLLILLGVTFAVVLYGSSQSPSTIFIKPIWVAAALLTFMAPTIFAYGRIMGASWNMILINKWRTANGRANPIDPDKPRFVNRLFSLLLVIFLVTMPITALNGVITVYHILFNDPDPDKAFLILNYGGVLGYMVFERVDLIAQILFEWQFIKELPQFLSLYLSLNIAIVGLAFIFELTRNLVLGGQSFGGLFGVTLDTPREIRTEVEAQSRQLTFAFAGFSGYTVLLLILVCYKEFGSLMPFTDTLEAPRFGFDERARLEATWMFIALGQAVFLFTWALSVIRFRTLRTLRFDLNPDERREGAVKFAEGDWMRSLVEEAAISEDLDALIQFQRRSLEGDPSLIRHEKARARMWELALRGLWPKAIEEAKKVLAQAGGDDDICRMIIATGHMASRRLDAAREALHGLQQPEGYDEPELLAFVCEWLDPWQGKVEEDDFWDWENNSCIDHLQILMRMLRGWQPAPTDQSIHNDRLTRVAQLSMVSLMRAQRRHSDALDLALQLVRADPIGVRPRIAVALCLIDKGDWHSARSILSELKVSDGQDPRVLSLAAILGQSVDEEEMEVALAVSEGKKIRQWINDAPVNAVAGLVVRGGMDEAINANILIAAHEATRRGMPPRFTFGWLSIVYNYLVLVPLWIVLAIFVNGQQGQMAGLVVLTTLLLVHIGSRRFSRQQRRVIRHRDQKAMVAYSRRMKRFKVSPERGNIPVGTHLLLSGMLVTVNGVVLDLGMPGWLSVRLPKDTDKAVKSRLKRQSKSIAKSRPPRLQPLGDGWWLKRPKEEGAEVPALERLIGQAAYRGRQQYVAKKKGKAISQTVRTKPTTAAVVTEINLDKRGIPTNTRVSERVQTRRPVPPTAIGSKKPGPNVKPQPKQDMGDTIDFS